MFRWMSVVCGAAIALSLAGAAQAADYNLVRWRSGDCQIWNNDTNRMPWGDGWILLAWNMPNYDTALNALKVEVAKGNCRW
jgi:hypothetical protein